MLQWFLLAILIKMLIYYCKLLRYLIHFLLKWEWIQLFLDRIHCYLPGWEVPKFRPDHFTDDYGFITDYFAEFIRELRKTQESDALDKYFKLGKNLNQRDTISVRKTVSGLVKLIYPNGKYDKEELEEIIRIALEMRRRVKEQLKKIGGMESAMLIFHILIMIHLKKSMYQYQNKVLVL